MMLRVCILLTTIFLTGLSVSQNKPELVIDTQGHSGIVNGLIVNPEGNKLISVSEDKTIRIWNLTNGDLERTLRTQAETGFLGRIYAAALSPDGRFLAIAGYFKNNEIRIIDLFKRSDVAILEGHENIITKLRFTKDGTKLASASADKTARVWSIKYLGGKIYGELDKTLSGHEGQVYDVAFSPNGGKLVSSSYDGSLRLWNLGAENPSGISMKMHADKVFSTAFSHCIGRK